MGGGLLLCVNMGGKIGVACYCVSTWGEDRGGLLLCVNMGGRWGGGGGACYFWMILHMAQ